MYCEVADAPAARFARPQGDALTLPSGAGVAGTGFSTCCAASSSGIFGSNRATRALPANCAGGPV